jgi:hypothetical protein
MKALPNHRGAGVTALSLAVPGTKINSSNPALPTISAANPAPPLLGVFHPPIKLTGMGPGSHIHRYRRINCPPIRFDKLLQVVVAQAHEPLEHFDDF